RSPMSCGSGELPRWRCVAARYVEPARSGKLRSRRYDQTTAGDCRSPDRCRAIFMLVSCGWKSKAPEPQAGLQSSTNRTGSDCLLVTSITIPTTALVDDFKNT